MLVLTGRLQPAASERSACRMGPRVKPEDDGALGETSGKRRDVSEFQQNAQTILRKKHVKRTHIQQNRCTLLMNLLPAARLLPVVAPPSVVLGLDPRTHAASTAFAFEL